jgi:O-antigen/teichoic acid export membrane protein
VSCGGTLIVVREPSGAVHRNYEWVRATFQRPIVRNATSLFSSTVVTSLLGFVFWLLAAKLLAPASVGRAAALQSACQLLSYVCIFGLGTLSIAELTATKRAARQLIATTAITTAVIGLIAGLSVGVILIYASPSLRVGLDGGLRLGVFAVLTSTTTAAVLLDDVSIGLRRSNIQLHRNVVFAMSKLIFLAVMSIAWTGTGGTAILSAWLAGQVVSLLFIRKPLSRATVLGSWRPAFRALLSKRRLIYNHHWLNVSVLAPRQLLPIIVTWIVSPAADAGFYVALFVVAFVNVIPTQLSTALFALKPGDEAALREEIRVSMKICVVLAAVSGPVFLFGSRIILESFRHSYVNAAPAMAILGFSTLPSAIKAHYVAIARVRQKMGRAAVRTSIAALVEVAASIAGAELDGVTGVAIGLFSAYVLEALLLGPTVVRTMYSPHVDNH